MVPRSERGQQTPLTVNLDDIPPEGLKMDCEVTPEWLELPTDEGKVDGVFHWEGSMVKMTEGASVSGTLSGVITRQCVRCLREFKDPVSISCMGVFQPSPIGANQMFKAEQKSALDEDPEEVAEEMYPCDGNQVELGKMLREQVILCSPIQPYCRQDCLGLCQICGHNLNQGSCRCAENGSFSQLGTIRFRVNKAKTTKL